VIIGLVLTAIIGYIDYATGYELRMELLYVLPISYVTWYVGQRAGIVFAFLSIITTICSDIMAGKRFTQYTIELWNGVMYLFFYVVVTFMLKFRISLQQRENLIEELDRALVQNEELSGLLPLCPNCRKKHVEAEYRRKVEAYITKHPKPELIRSYCKECSGKL
jgi:hypothetical protein